MFFVKNAHFPNPDSRPPVEAQNARIVSLLETRGIPRYKVTANGPFLSFPYRGIRVHFICFPDVIKVYFFREPLNEYEKFLTRQPLLIAGRGDSFAEKFRKEFLFQQFDGHMDLQHEIEVTLAIIEATMMT